MKIKELLNRETAQRLIENYCYETPREDAIERLLASDELCHSLDYLGIAKYVFVAPGWAIEQDALDRILYGEK